jgi:hypothetical protein
MTKFLNVRQNVAASVLTLMMTTLFVAGAVAPAVHQPTPSPLTQVSA